MASKQLIADVFKPLMLDIDQGKHSEYWIKGGRGSTKSSFISLVIVLGLLEDKDASAIVYRRVGNTLFDSVYAQILWAIDMLGVADMFSAKRSPLEIYRKGTGQRILFRGTDDPLKSKSIKLIHGYFKYLWLNILTTLNPLNSWKPLAIRQS